ncbi:MAG TPA: acyltransferase family protein, partial [Planctomycetota bacterium]|nr:acyltransferase family protein [Planctomycetota bacterium]
GCYALFYHSLGSGQAEAPWATAALQAVIAAWGTLCCLMLGLRLLARPSSKLRFVGASAYWTYLAHLPLVFAIQYVLLDRDWPLIVKFTLTTLVTLALCFASYALLVRCTPLRRFVG